MIHRLTRTQTIHCNLNEAWDFFSSPHNLSEITPKHMNFRVTSKNLSQQIYSGMIIEYKVSPLFGIPVNWRTKITNVEDYRMFVDFQEKGPYNLWRHVHEFEAIDNGVLMKDVVEYQLPFGVIGDFLHWVFIKRKLKNIFDYRYEKLELLFNQKSNK